MHANAARKSALSQMWKHVGTTSKPGIPSLLVFDSDKRDCSCQDIVYGFDLDGTLITTTKGSGRPRDCRDWRFRDPNIVTKLRDLQSHNIKTVIFTNQAGISLGHVSVNNICSKIEDIVRSVDVQLQVFVSTSYDRYRKPNIGMWEYMEAHCNGGVKVKRKRSLFVGDAAGRKGDHADSDKLFAQNLHVPFNTPEQFFIDHHQ